MEVDAEFEDLEAEIADLEAELAACRRGAFVARGAIIVGGIVLAASIFLYALRTAPFAFGAIAAMIGGTVWAGASKSSREEIEARLAAAQVRNAALFDRVAAENGWRDTTPTVH